MRLLQKPTVHYNVYKNPPLLRAVSQIKPAHSLLSSLPTIHFNIIYLLIVRHRKHYQSSCDSRAI